MMSQVEEGGAGVNHRISSGQKMGRQLSRGLNELKAGVQERLDEERSRQRGARVQDLRAGDCRTQLGVEEQEEVCGAEHSVQENREESRDTVMWTAGEGTTTSEAALQELPAMSSWGLWLPVQRRGLGM